MVRKPAMLSRALVLLFLVAIASVFNPGLSRALPGEAALLGFRAQPQLYGAGATIGTSNPNVGSTYYSREVIEARSNDSFYILRVGWHKSFFCGSTPRFYYHRENFTTGLLQGTCIQGVPVSGDNDFYLEYNGSNQYWCHGMNGTCRINAVNGFGVLTNLSVMGTTSQKSNPPQMGGASQGVAVWISNVKYKPTPNATPSQWLYVTSALGGSQVNQCSGTCPYGFQTGYAASVLYTFNWTK